MTIYKITNTVNGKVYIGQTRLPVRERFINHCCSDSKLGNAIREHGKDVFTIDIVARSMCSYEISALERHYIQQYNSTNDDYGYNVRPGGGCKRKRPYQRLRQYD